MWQDIVIAIVSIGLSISLLPQVWHGFSHKKSYVVYSSSIPTAVGLLIMSIAYFTLGMMYTAITTFIVGVMWSLLLVQRIIYPKA